MNLARMQRAIGGARVAAYMYMLKGMLAYLALPVKIVAIMQQLHL